MALSNVVSEGKTKTNNNNKKKNTPVKVFSKS